MGKYSVEYLSIAYDDLDEFFTYHAVDDPEAAVSFLTGIDTAILYLEHFPDMGIDPKNHRLTTKGYKMLIVEEYLVFYVLVDCVVEIRRIIARKENYTKLL